MSRRRRASRASRLLNRLPAPLLGNPLELFVAAFCCVQGVSILAGALPAGSIESVLPDWLVYAWAAELTVGGGAVVAGVLTHRRRVERAGLIQLGPASLAYGTAIAIVLGWRVTALMLYGFGLACLARAVVLVAADKMRAELIYVARNWVHYPPIEGIDDGG
jgi:uncharacterized membrane protein